MSIESIDSEIRRLTEEIERLQYETLPRSPCRVPILPKYENLPDIVNIEIPKGFVRAPVTCPIDLQRAERQAAAETKLRDALVDLNRRDAKQLLNQILRHQRKNPLGGDVERVNGTNDRVMEKIKNDIILCGL
jgi:hypothetical protein